MRKLSLLLALALVAALLTPAALAATSGKCGANITWNLNTSTKKLTINGSGRMYDYSLNSYPPWYTASSYGENITAVEITGNISYIGNYAFYDLSSVPYIALPDSVVEIGKSAFYWCTSLTGIEIPSKVQVIGDDAFSYCSKATTLTLPDSLTTIGNYAFYRCSGVTSLTLPKDLTTFNEAFMDCRGLTSLTLPDGLTTISYAAFYGCKSLTSLALPDSLTDIGAYAFSDCDGLTEVTIPASVTSYGRSAFTGKALEAIYVDAGSGALSSRGGILFNKEGTVLMQYPSGRPDKSYALPVNVQLYDSAFSSCSALTHVDLPGTLTTISNYAFSRCSALTELVIPEGVTALGEKAFYYSGIQRLILPESVTSIDASIVDDCPEDLTLCVVVGSKAHTWAVEKNKNYEIVFPRFPDELTLPEDLTLIEEEAFEGIDATAVRVPAGVTEIRMRAFANCPNLRHVYLPGVKKLEAKAFEGCGALYLYGPEGSVAETYAERNSGVEFIPLNP